jgi:hypothetical protein
MTLSLSHCSSNQGSPWHQLGGNVQPVLYGHEAIKTVFDDTEWMVLTGGFRPHSTEPSAAADQNATAAVTQYFHVWLMNLTHADLFGEAEWFQMTPFPENSTSTTTATTCPPFLSNATHDPWHRADLWESAVACAPTPRTGHITTIINDYLYVFHGYPEGADRVDIETATTETSSPQDIHTYRISMSAVLANQWSEWRRIVPRSWIDSNSNTTFPLKGGLWKVNEIELPELVVLVPDYDDDHNPFTQLWMYDFTTDSWESTHVLYMYSLACPYVQTVDGLVISCEFRYSAIVVRNYFIVVGTFAGGTSKYVYMMDLQNAQEDSQFFAASDTIPLSSLVTYEDATKNDGDNSDDSIQESVIVGIGPAPIGGDDSLVHMGAMTVAFDSQQLMEGFNPIQIRQHTKGYPPYRIGSTAVMSSAGNLYLFGGYTLDVDSESVWKINIGGTECNLDIDWNDHGAPPPCQYDCPQDEDQAAQDKLLLLLSVFSMMFWFCGRPPQHDGRHHLPGGVVLQQQRGLTPQQLEMFPPRTLSEGEEQTEEDNTCSICLSNFTAGDEVRDLPCTHFFHSSCVDGWLQAETTCPLCRESCRPVVDARELDLMTPVLVTHLVQWLRRDMREPVPVNDNDTHGLEMGSLYSLELQDTSTSGGDDESVGTNATSASRRVTMEPTDEGRERRRRRGRRDEGERSVPLTAAPDSTLT